MKRRYRAAAIALTVIACLCFAITLVAAFFAIADGLCEKNARYVPNYEKIDLAPLLEKEEWSEEDYETIYRQTGLTKVGADSVERTRLLSFQTAFFNAGEVYHEFTTPITPHDKLMDPDTETDILAPIVPLENGDILVTSTTHLFGWRHGHAALVVDAATETLLESVAIGIDSRVTTGGARWFRRSSNFMVLRLKDADAAKRAEIAKNARNELVGIPYNVFLGFFMPKDQCKNGKTPSGTHCSHLVWQAFRNAGYDLDSTGGPLVTAKDISHSPYLEVVQVYGFDLDTLWG